MKIYEANFNKYYHRNFISNLFRVYFKPRISWKLFYSLLVRKMVWVSILAQKERVKFKLIVKIYYRRSSEVWSSLGSLKFSQILKGVQNLIGLNIFNQGGFND